MVSATFTLVLTNATHLVNAPAADRIAKAIDERSAYVDVQVDLFGDGSCVRQVRLMTQHVVMLMRNEQGTQRDTSLEGLFEGKVRAIAPHRFR
jgi:hypothetical protein